VTLVLRRPWLLAAVVAALALFAVLAQPARDAGAHPLGNFTINRYTRIELYSDVARLYYVLDMAEIPTVQETGGALTGSEADEHLAEKTAEITAKLTLTFDGEAAGLTVVDTDLAFPEGQGGLATTRISLVLEAAVPAGDVTLAYADGNYSDRLGWKEVVVVPAAGVVTSGDFATEDRSAALTSYPADLLSSPPDVTTASLAFNATNATPAPAIVVTQPPPASASRSTTGFASLIDTENLTLPVVILALLAAFGFGALHALEPGHGKTMVAAYFVGVKGTARHAMTLGLIVAVTHTVGVLALGAVIIFGSQWIVPERLYPWLSLASGVMIVLLGLRLLASQGGAGWLRRLAHRVLPHRHHHHEHGHAPGATVPPWRSLVALGLADGLTPSPSAIVVLLAAVSLDRIGLGFALIVAFSAGLAFVLAGVSIVLMYARSAMEWFSSRLGEARGGVIAAVVSPEGAILRLAPLVASVGLLGAGLYLTLRALSGVSV
jgi:ABC-type nickel/cobalt efflux system permease component RcnA